LLELVAVAASLSALLLPAPEAKAWTVGLSTDLNTQCVGGKVVLTATVGDIPTPWEGGSVTVNFSDSMGAIGSAQASPDSGWTATFSDYSSGLSGTRDVTASANGAASSPQTVTWVKIQGVSLSTSYAVPNSTVQCTTVIHPFGAGFPAGKPSWTADYGAASPAAGSATTWTAPDPFLSPATITASGCSSSDATVSPLTISASAPDVAADGANTGIFDAVLGPAGASYLEDVTFTWGFDVPANSGNDPQIAWVDDHAPTTTAMTAHWYATPDSHLAHDTGHLCTYDVWCEVSYNGGTLRSPSAAFLVSVGNPQGVTDPPTITGQPDLQEAGSYWYVSGKGSLARTSPYKHIFLNPSSQFYDKADVHESKHVTQWTSEFPWAGLFSADAFYALISGHQEPNYSLLQTWVSNQRAMWLASDLASSATHYDEAECDAFAEDAKVSPHYLEVVCP
jgi:hypothetical protein